MTKITKNQRKKFQDRVYELRMTEKDKVNDSDKSRYEKDSHLPLISISQIKYKLLNP